MSGGLDPCGVRSADLGRPIVLQISPNPFRTSVFAQIGGGPNLQVQPPTDGSPILCSLTVVAVGPKSIFWPL